MITRDYGQFILYENYHRKTTAKYTFKLERRILRDNKLSKWPIWVTEKMEIVDGRHRYLIARKNNLELHYIVKYNSADYHNWIKGKFLQTI